MSYIGKERFTNKTFNTTVVEVRRRDAGNWDAMFIGMGDDGMDVHVVLNTTKYADLCDSQLYTVKKIGG
jgi:hypothetical protein|tara:strand:- start:3 stop:209 length:207 start_codon:yes stop_codon:yes gene_type:complete